jgi:two-component system, cell cycle sensor histidine kinase and response regulator CckA
MRQLQTILLIDDDAAIVKAVSRTLTDLGFAVLTADDGESAVEIFREQHAEIDAVVLDYALPLMSGGQAFSQMQQIDSRVPAWLATGHGSSEE